MSRGTDGGSRSESDGPEALLSRWLRGREAEVPEPFRPWLQEHLEAAPTGPDVTAALTELGARALGRALVAAGSGRRGAFDLLAADALLTWACEAAAEAEDPEAALDGVLREVGRASR